MTPRNGGSYEGRGLLYDSFARDIASSSTVGRGGGGLRGPRLRLRSRGGSRWETLRKDGALFEIGVELWEDVRYREDNFHAGTDLDGLFALDVLK